MITIRIDTPPRGKGRPRFGQHKNAYTDQATRVYEKLLRDVAALEMRGKPILEGPLSVHVTAFMGIPESWPKKKQCKAMQGEIKPTGRPDSDNIQKGVWDSFNGIVWKDDAQIVHAVVEKRYSSSPALVVVARAA